VDFWNIWNFGTAGLRNRKGSGEGYNEAETNKSVNFVDLDEIVLT